MDRSEYTKRVLAQLKGTTREETEAIRAELEGHMEDHMSDLLDLGYAEDVAEERVLSMMGDPEEVGRELDKQYPRRWQTIEAIACFVTVLCVLEILMSLGLLDMMWDSVTARFETETKTGLETVYAEEQLDHRIPVGNDVLRVMAVRVGKEGGVTYAEVYMTAYDRIPGRWVDSGLIDNVKLWNEEWIDDPLLLNKTGADSIRISGGGGGHIFREYTRRYIPINADDTRVYLTYDRFGESFELEIPLPEVSQ